MNKLTRDDMLKLLADEGMESAVPTINKWLARGDGAAVYENHDLGHPEIGHKQIVSFGSESAQLETDEPPKTLPDMATINWRYQLVGTYRGDLL